MKTLLFLLMLVAQSQDYYFPMSSITVPIVAINDSLIEGQTVEELVQSDNRFRIAVKGGDSLLIMKSNTPPSITLYRNRPPRPIIYGIEYSE